MQVIQHQSIDVALSCNLHSFEKLQSKIVMITIKESQDPAMLTNEQQHSIYDIGVDMCVHQSRYPFSE